MGALKFFKSKEREREIETTVQKKGEKSTEVVKMDHLLR